MSFLPIQGNLDYSHFPGEEEITGHIFLDVQMIDSYQILDQADLRQINFEVEEEEGSYRQ